MPKFKDGLTPEQAAEKIIRSYLLRCYSRISQQYSPIAHMKPEEGVDYLLQLRQAGKIDIEFETVGELVMCSITPIDPS